MGFPRQEYWSGLPFPSPGDLPDPEIKPALTGRFFTTKSPGKLETIKCISIDKLKTVNKHVYGFNLLASFTDLEAHFKKIYLLTQTVQLTTKSIHLFIKTHC